jgi:hypothetical protein
MEIQGYPGYLIYDDGRVWSKPRKDSRGNQRKGKFLKHVKIQTGYHRVQLCRDGKLKGFYVSRLVALHHIPNPDGKPDVDHIDRDKDNNHVSNLRWVTRQENMQNLGIYRNNTSGHKYISYSKRDKKWYFRYRKNGHKVLKTFDTKHDALWFKIIFLMELKYMS